MENLTDSNRTETITVTKGKTYSLASNGVFDGATVNVAVSIDGDDTTPVPLYAFDSHKPMTYPANGTKIFLELVGGGDDTDLNFSATELE